MSNQSLFAIISEGNTVAEKYQEGLHKNTDHMYTDFHNDLVGYESQQFSVALTHLTNLDFYERTDSTLTQLYFQGIVHEDYAVETVMELQKSWQNPPELLIESKGTDYLGYSQPDRAFLLERKSDFENDILLTLNASDTSPVNGLAISIENWNADRKPNLFSEEISVEDAKFGIENENELIIWLPIQTTEDFSLAVYAV